MEIYVNPPTMSKEKWLKQAEENMLDMFDSDNYEESSFP